jgi:hypothetical protein
MENNSFIQQCLFLLSAMPLQVPVHSHSDRGDRHQSRHVFPFPMSCLRARLLRVFCFFVVIVGGLSAILFTCIVMLASFITTFFLSAFEEPTYYYSPFFYVSPLDLAQDLITATLRILKDGDIIGTFDEGVTVTSRTRSTDSGPLISHKPRPKPSLVGGFIRRFILGIPMVGAGSLVHMLLSAPLLGPLQWLARQRGSRRRRDQSRDIAAVIIIVLIVVGAARFVIIHLTRLSLLVLNGLIYKGSIQGLSNHRIGNKTAPPTSRGCNPRGQLISKVLHSCSFV